jgi:stress-induced morphogen
LSKSSKVEEYKLKKVQFKADEKDNAEEKADDDDVTIELLSKELSGLSLVNRER